MNYESKQRIYEVLKKYIGFVETMPDSIAVDETERFFAAKGSPIDDRERDLLREHGPSISPAKHFDRRHELP